MNRYRYSASGIVAVDEEMMAARNPLDNKSCFFESRTARLPLTVGKPTLMRRR